MLRSLVGRVSRWIRRTSSKYCTVELDNHAKGLAECLVRKPPTKEEKAEKYRQRLLRNVSEDNHAEVIRHFKKLGNETDPMENNVEVVDDSIKKIVFDKEEMRARIEMAFREEVVTDAELKAKHAIDGCGRWPIGISKAGFTKNKKKKN